jgi:hypothetical protein
MKFTTMQTVRYWWPVTLRMPDPIHPGKIVEHTLQVQFEPESREEATLFQEGFAGLATPREVQDHEHGRLRRIVKSWSDMSDDDGEAVPFTPENFETAIRWQWFRTGVYDAYADSLNGQEARSGN